MIRLVFALTATIIMLQESAYEHLSTRGRELFRGSATDYDAMSESKQTTFHAIVHALEAVRIDHLVVSVDRIWGADITTRNGRDQYRLSVTLTEDAVDELRARDDFEENRLGHVKRQNGDLVGDLGPLGLGFFGALTETQSVRQKSSPASIQISWLTGKATTGDIDIDYVSRDITNLFDHLDQRNSDITYRTHYQRHIRTFGDLSRWWR